MAFGCSTLFCSEMASVGAWRRPRMKVYDYNQEFGGNYYQARKIIEKHY
jgi:hypothetical protein